MDFNRYIKQSDKIKRLGTRIKKKCLQCSKPLENDGTYLYYQSFCSSLCKEKYCEL